MGTKDQRSLIRRIADAGDKVLDANEKSKSSRWAKKIDRIANRFLAFWGALIAAFIGFLTIGNFRTIVDDVNAYIEPEGDSSKGSGWHVGDDDLLAWPAAPDRYVRRLGKQEG